MALKRWRVFAVLLTTWADRLEMSASRAFALPLSASALRSERVTKVLSKTSSCALKVLAVFNDSEAIMR
ncbi:hypothetical protein D3C84_948720 [compost metagenome]